MSLDVPNIIHVTSIVNLILTLRWDPLNESVFVLTLKLGLITGIMQLNLQYHVTTSQKYI